MLPIALDIFLEEIMAIGENLKKLGMGVAGLLSGLFLLALPVILIFGLTWVSVLVSPWLVPAFLWTLAISIFILGPLAVIQRTRGFSAAGLLIASYVFGACLWITSLLLTYELWGTIAVVIGLVILGIGIVPVALLASLFHAQWWHLLDLVMLIVATFGTRLLAVWLAEKVDADRYAQAESQPSDCRRTGQQNWVMPLSILGALAVVTLLVARWLHPNEGLSATQVFSQAAGSVVRIQVSRQDGSEIIGSGFVAVLESHPYILTNRHVVENADRVKVAVREDLMFDVPNYWVTESVNLALLEIPVELQLRSLPLRRTAVQPGDVIGFPLGLAESITQGLVTATYANALQFDAPISSGNSGGPVLDAHAEVIGVAAAGSKGNTEEILQNLNIAVPVTNFPPLASFRMPSSTAEAAPRLLATETLSPPLHAPPVYPTPEVRRALPPGLELPTANSTPLLRAPSYRTPGPTTTPIPNYADSTWPDGRMLIHPEHFVRTHVVDVAPNDTLNLRSGPGTSFDPVTNIPPNGTDIIEFDQDGDSWWCPVEWHGLRGYVSRRFLRTQH
jgi:MFS family permease